MSIKQKSNTTVYAEIQSAKGSAATVAAANAVDPTNDSTFVQPKGDMIDRGLIRGGRYPSKQVAGGRWGEGPLTLEMRGSGTAGEAPEFSPFMETLLGTKAASVADAVEAGSGAAGGFDASELFAVGQLVRVEIGSGYEVRRIATVSGSGPYSYTVQRDFSQAPADGAIIAAGVTYYHQGSEAEPYMTMEQYLDGIKLNCIDAAAESLQLTTNARDVIRGVFGIRSLTCADSEAADGLTPEYDDTLPLIGTDCNLILAASALEMRSFDFSLTTRRSRGGVNSSGFSDLPWLSKFEAAGNLTPFVEDVSPLTAFFAGTLADLEMTKGTSAGNILHIELENIQYTGAEIGEEEGDFSWSLPFVITGGVYIGFF